MARLFEPWRLFFPSALLLAPLNVLAWLAVRQGIVDWPAASASWHGREMVFGYSFAVIAGYLLPAFPLRRVVGLWLLWLLGRLAWIVPPGTLLPWLQLAAGAAFPATVAILGFRRFHAAKRARNLAFPMIMLVLGAAGVATYAAEVGWLPMPAQNPAVLSVYVVSLLVMVMGGRAVPTATVGSLRAQGRVLRVVPRPRLEAAGIFGMLSLLVKGGFDDAKQFCTRLKVLIAATSLGGVESLAEHRKTNEGPSSPVADNLVRLSIGIEHVDDLIADLEQALAGL